VSELSSVSESVGLREPEEAVNKTIRARFWIEIALALVTAGLFVVTLVWREWIELVFKVDPDSGDGSLEWAIVGVLLVATIVFAWFAGTEWRRATAQKT
jgi:hypothetical protein